MQQAFVAILRGHDPSRLARLYETMATDTPSPFDLSQRGRTFQKRTDSLAPRRSEWRIAKTIAPHPDFRSAP
jgi:hypothetical protein